jgi:hypothetical protein
MRNKTAVVAILAGMALAAAAAPAMAQFPITSTVTYQGQLENAGQPVSGVVNLRFGLFSAQTGGAAIVTRTVSNVTVTEGIFSTDVDFGLPAFANVQNLFVEVEVQSPAGAGAYTLLTPRRRLGAVAFAMNTRGVKVDGSNRVTLGDVNPAAATTGATLTLGPTGSDNKWSSLVTAAGTERWAWRLPTGNLELVANNSPSFQHTFEYATGNVAIADTAVSNPAAFSRVLSVTGRTTGSFAGSAGFVAKNPVTGSIWTVGVDGAGSFSFFHNGVGGQSVVSVPVLQITGGSDIAEPYDVAPAVSGDEEILPRPGMVVSIDAERIGKLKVAAKAYDAAVAGIISGANGVATGMTLTQAGTAAHGEMPIAKVGRVWVYADADANGPITAGDLLTTSATPGHAMRAEAGKAAGSVLGKAMSPLKEGKGMVLVLVGLQ